MTKCNETVVLMDYRVLIAKDEDLGDDAKLALIHCIDKLRADHLRANDCECYKVPGRMLIEQLATA